MIPRPDPTGLPAPAALLQALSIAAFLLHLFPMNLLLGGGFLSAAASWRAAHARRAGREKQALHYTELARATMRAMPIAAAAAINLGVPPLLFLQTLYGQSFFTSSIMIGWIWLAAVALVPTGYYAWYALGDLNAPESRRHRLISCAIALTFATVAFIFVNNMSLMLRPHAWHEMYAQSDRGAWLNTGDPTLWPRYLHFLFGANAVTGLVVACAGRLRSRATPELGAAWQVWGAWQFRALTLLQMASGIWLLLAIPEHARDSFLGARLHHAALLWGAVFCALLALLVVRRWPFAAAGLIALTVTGMVITRHNLRTLALEPHWRAEDLAVAPQWGAFAAFIILSIAGIGVVAWMIRKLVIAPRPDVAS